MVRLNAGTVPSRQLALDRETSTQALGEGTSVFFSRRSVGHGAALMNANGAPTLSDLSSPRLVLACTKCDRLGAPVSLTEAGMRGFA